MRGFNFFERQMLNGTPNGWSIVSYHPKNCLTWHWYFSIEKIREGESRVPFRYFPPFRKSGQWHHRLNLICGYFAILGRQDYHKKEPQQ